VNVATYLDHNGEPLNETIPRAAYHYKQTKRPWALIVDENYGEGSAREHAALQPRYYGCTLIVARSFARIHETNLKKQGILPLWFVSKDDYGRIGSTDIIETLNLQEVLGGRLESTIRLRVTKHTGEAFEIITSHTLSSDQVNWLKAGSALNFIRSRRHLK